ncbi:hypothetical protein C8039_13405 [Halogeometricum sp. wsp3]|nr:hypothetical protein C8039_13405 [Halogeometricum sp. wsp3]
MRKVRGVLFVFIAGALRRFGPHERFEVTLASASEHSRAWQRTRCSRCRQSYRDLLHDGALPKSRLLRFVEQAYHLARRAVSRYPSKFSKRRYTLHQHIDLSSHGRVLTHVLDQLLVPRCPVLSRGVKSVAVCDCRRLSGDRRNQGIPSGEGGARRGTSLQAARPTFLPGVAARGTIGRCGGQTAAVAGGRWWHGVVRAAALEVRRGSII